MATITAASQTMQTDTHLNATSRPNGAARESQGNIPLEIATLNGEKLIVTDQDAVFDAARSLFHEHGLGNVMFLGDAGSGKTRLAESLTLSHNYRLFLAGTPLAGLTVHIQMIEVDLISTSASAELLYDASLENGCFSRQSAIVSEFIQAHGTTDRAAFDAQRKARSETIRAGEGEVTLYILVVDDFDRSYRELQSSFMKLIHGVRHTFQRLKVPPYYLHLQCIATSNSGLGTPSGKYTAAAGKIDAAVANRFQCYTLPDPDFEFILARRFPTEPDFCRVLSEMVTYTKSKQRDGELESLGEVSLRQILPLVEHKIRYGLTSEAAAARLFFVLPPDGDERTQANLIMSRFFGRRHRTIGEFTF